MSPSTLNNIWTYFKLDESNRDKSRCKICNKSYWRKGCTTTSLKNHLKSRHTKEFCLFESSNNEKQLKKKKDDADKILTPLQEARKQLSLEEVFQKGKKWDTKIRIRKRGCNFFYRFCVQGTVWKSCSQS
ncbi:uncharacterized protein LOC112494810 [Cephus cinctus]|uniref:Uncharacterized protein LOC112494810 n=1 Tax=Cephus cinctus TaxID=211228 RepID=A0AAJ7RMV0_CEPCN|nr:uncharacterized protein LOC112494810 [Cephus cinctus]